MLPEQATACADKAERTTAFCTVAARHWVLNHLQANGPQWSEAIVRAARDTGRETLMPHDGRAFGAVFGALSRGGWIVCLRADGVRSNGRGTSGARLWALQEGAK